jgi:dTDP-L-rhamnose 4-epimerase
MTKSVLVIGGAGFIGGHIVDKLVNRGYSVKVLDNLSATSGKVPSYLNKKAEFIKGDIRNKELLKLLVKRCDAIFHEASKVGIAQSNYCVTDFVENNCLGTSSLAQAIIDTNSNPKVILSSSNTSYGEGVYRCKRHGTFHPPIRSKEYVEREGFDIKCPTCGSISEPFPTPEETNLNCNSIYAQTKRFQEESMMLLGKLYGFPVVSLRYFNVFGPRQSLSNPYTGVSAIFVSRIKSGKPPILYEDGLQTRDFVFIDDVVDANILSLENPNANYGIFNVGSGKPITIKKLAESIFKLFNKKPNYKISRKFRKGDIRHCIADKSAIKKVLGWEPKHSFDYGIQEFFKWSISKESKDNFHKAERELAMRKLA